MIDAPPAACASGEPLASPAEPLNELSATGVRKQAGVWTLTFFPDVVRVAKGQQVFVYSREEIATTTTIKLYGQSGSVIGFDGWDTGLIVDWVGTRIFRQWMEPRLDQWARTNAVRNARGSIVGGIAGVVTWAWLGGWVLLAFAVVSLLTGLGRRFRPGRWLLLAVAARAVIVGVVLGAAVLFADASPWWILLVLLDAIFGWTSFVKYRFFAPRAPELE